MKLFEKKKDLSLNESSGAMPAIEVDEEDEILRRRKPNKAMIVTGLSIFAMVVLILSSLPNGEKGTSVNSRVLNVKPSMQSMSTVITGAGALAPGSTEKVELPKVIDLKKYYVHNGDKVLKGDVLASVDKIQVSAAIAELQDVLNTLDKDINSESSKSGSTAIKSGVAGRVKAIFARVGTEVSETVYENGCLMLLSLDGLMQVQFTPDEEVQVGQVVDVQLSDGSVQTGKVYAYSDGKATVTLSDLNAEYGSAVVVKTTDGKVLGSGDLDIHSPLQVSGYYGTVNAVNVKLNQKVSNNTTLITLKETGHTPDYTALLKRRNELSKQMDVLYAMSDGFIHATKDGIVSEVPENAEYADAEEMAEVSPVAFDGMENVKLDWLVGGEQAKLVMLADESGNPMDMLADLKGFVISTDGNVTIIPLTELDGIVYHESAELLTVDPSILAMIFPDEAGTIEKLPVPNISVDKIYNFKVIQVPVISKWMIVSATESMPEGMNFDISALLGGIRGFGSFASFGSSSASNKVYDTYSTETDTILELIPQDELTVTINIDELDILKLHEGMDADITMDAFPGTTFPGVITRVGSFGTNSGGNSKYAVEVTLNTTEQMLVGMNASIRITTGQSPEVMSIPTAALVEENGKTWVYTKYEKSKDVLTGLVEVTTGISDGNLVEITGGIGENTTVYYRYADSIVYSFA